MKISLQGAAVGALIGAVGRSIVVFFWLGGVAPVAALPSAAIGLLVGTIAGAIGQPRRGAIVGFILSAFVFEAFMCSCASLVGDFDGAFFGRKDSANKFLLEALPYALLMGLAGATAGAIGGTVGRTEMDEKNPDEKK